MPGPPANQDVWHYQLGAQQLGPVSFGHFVSMMRNGVIAPTTLVWCEGMPQWVAASSVPQLAAIFDAPAMDKKPGKVQALSIITLVSGCYNAVHAVFFFFYVLMVGVMTFGLGCVLIVLPIYLGIVATLEILYAMKILATPMKTNQPSKVVPILQVICVLACNPITLAAGILGLVFNNDPDVKAYFAATPAPVAKRS